MNPPTQPDYTPVILALVSVLSAALVATIGALCYFLRRLVDKTIPEQGRLYADTSAKQLATFQSEMATERKECREQHEHQNQLAAQRHGELISALYGERRHGDRRQPSDPYGPREVADG